MNILKEIKMFFHTIFKFLIKRKILASILILILFFVSVALFFFESLPDVKELLNSVPKKTSMIKYRIKQNLKSGKTLRIRKRWVGFDRIPYLLKKTVLVSEDINFYSHHGVDYYELKESIKKNFRTGKKSRGGSTITQQLAKNLFLSTKKSYYRKIKEFFIAKKLEKYLSKNRIFELYLNIIEFGHGIFGVEAASEVFFKKTIDHLELEEIIRLVSVIPKPLRVTPLSNSNYLKWRANLLINRLFRSKAIAESELIRLKDVFKKDK